MRSVRSIAATVVLSILVLAGSAPAHPLDRDAYSLRSGLKMGPSGLMAVVILEKPTQFVLADLARARDPFTGKRAGEARELAGEEAEDSAPTRRPGQDEQNAYARRHFQELAEGLTMSIDGVPVEQRFGVRNSRINGKAGRGFFVYIVELTVPPQPDWDDSIEVVIRNDGFQVEPMYYSGLARAEGRWSVQSDSAADRLGDDRGSGLPDDPRSWTTDDVLRTLRAVFVSKPSADVPTKDD